MKLKVVLEPQEDGGYTVYVPSLPGCISQGETIEEALKNMKEVIELSNKQGLKPKFMVGGAVVNEKYARSIGAEYAKDGVDAVRVVKNLIK